MMHMSTANLVLLLLIMQAGFTLHSALVDYWDDDYDKGKNCESQEEIEKLKASDENQCVENYIIHANESIESCKRSLATQLLFKCKMTGIEEAGELMFCRNRGLTICCFHKHRCMETWTGINKNYEEIAVQYLADKEKSLSQIRLQYGYKTCHAIDGYDATKCAEDCDRFKTSYLAKECEKRNGVFKCCIRRDKANCHECRFCCTTPFCTYKNGHDIQQLGEDHLGSLATPEDQDNSLNSLDYLKAYNLFYKGMDTRCLKPYSHRKPEEWRNYVPEDFVNALTEGELKKARTKKFNKRFFNFEDPAVFKMMMGKNRKKHFRETYGVDYVNSGNVILDKKKLDSHSFTFPCAKKCLQLEKGSFAKKCREKKGLFKCCINTLTIEVFESTRRRLKKEKLVKSATRICDSGENKMQEKCILCILTVFCSVQDAHTGQIVQEYRTKSVDPVGGVTLFDAYSNLVRTEFRTALCIKLDFCSVNERQFDISQYYFATARAQICKIPTTIVDEMYLKKETSDGKAKEESQDNCRNRTSNVRICPASLLKDDKYLLELNKELEKVKKKKTKKKSSIEESEGSTNSKSSSKSTYESSASESATESKSTQSSLYKSEKPRTKKSKKSGKTKKSKSKKKKHKSKKSRKKAEKKA